MSQTDDVVEEPEGEVAQPEPQVVEVGTAYLVVNDNNEIMGASWKWDDKIVEPQQAVVALNTLKRCMLDVGWTAQVVLNAQPKEDKETL